MLLYSEIASGAAALLIACLAWILFEEIEHPGDVPNAWNYAWSAVALAVLSAVLLAVYLTRRAARRAQLKQAKGHDPLL
ncbi:hypothetical protein C5E06_02740 [Pseudoclavibacter sp. RFBI5]|nr:hypothetical protein C5E06_02740 [Pseudoclavibacter sp. RFBI5]